MRLVVVRRGKKRLIGRDNRNAARIGEFDQRRLGKPLGRHAVALQLDIEPVAEQALQYLATPGRECALACDDRRVERPARPAGQRDQAIGLALEPGELEMRRLVRRRFQEGTGIEPHQAAVAILAGGQEHDARTLDRRRAAAGARAGLLIGEIDGQGAADNRLYAGGRHLLGKLERTEHVVSVGERQSRLSIGLCQLREPRDGHRALQQRIGGVDVQMNETRISHKTLTTHVGSCGSEAWLSTTARR
jgi:hypothetical protein